LVDAFTIEVIDRIRTDDGIERTSFEGQFADISSFDCGASVDACRFQVREQPLLRIWTRPKVLFEGFGKEIHGDESGLWPRYQDHYRRSTGARSHIEHSPGVGPQEALGRQFRHSICIETEPLNYEGSAGP
jgi:hypothetical protein